VRHGDEIVARHEARLITPEPDVRLGRGDEGLNGREPFGLGGKGFLGEGEVLDLRDVENDVLAQHRSALRFLVLLVDFQRLGEDNVRAALAFAHVRLVIECLLERHPRVGGVAVAVSARPQDWDVDAAVGAAGDGVGRHDVGFRIPVGFPGANPGNRSALHLSDDRVGDALVHSHLSLPHNRSAGCAPSGEGEGGWGTRDKKGTESAARSVPGVEPSALPRASLAIRKRKFRRRRIAADEFPSQVARDHEAGAHFGAVRAAPLVGCVGLLDEPSATPVFDRPACEGVDARRMTVHGSVLRCEHERQHACRPVRVGGIVRPEFEARVVIIEFPEEHLARELEAAKVVLAVRVVVGVKSVECRDLAHRHCLNIAREGADALGEHRAAERGVERFSERVVEFANAFVRWVVSERHVLLRAIDASR